jgi:hypothetical protein
MDRDLCAHSCAHALALSEDYQATVRLLAIGENAITLIFWSPDATPRKIMESVWI